jgi:hypothetical protein
VVTDPNSRDSRRTTIMGISSFTAPSVELGRLLQRKISLETVKDMSMERLVILDFTTGEVDIYPVEYEFEPDMDELLDSLGHNANDCQWMFTTGDIIFHKETLK